MAKGLKDALYEIVKDNNVKEIIFNGAGRGFCAEVDRMDEMASLLLRYMNDAF